MNSKILISKKVVKSEEDHGLIKHLDKPLLFKWKNHFGNKKPTEVALYSGFSAKYFGNVS